MSAILLWLLLLERQRRSASCPAAVVESLTQAALATSHLRLHFIPKAHTSGLHADYLKYRELLSSPSMEIEDSEITTQLEFYRS
ncbi:hypothetical protein BDP55DRAFT_654267 [Colletotrichum godetiae]|uniref:Uncharacterized protein n=1 Tax=Colletotrichum godetiae TaxID=1209918 RepID=A0AAJ0AUB8_9PEZI|nr:uncharacterized protein BDP55DRAFT_654267 [Colletotrichum godetiae]KAK1689116.1 hypothetical protein BDP55DRAFT_654267 [Colletotrichum godetiae]